MLNTWANAEDDESNTGERVTALYGYRFQVKIVSQTNVTLWILGSGTGLGFAKRYSIKFGDSSNFANSLVNALQSRSFLLAIHKYMFRTPALRAPKKWLSGTAYELYRAAEETIQEFQMSIPSSHY